MSKKSEIKLRTNIIIERIDRATGKVLDHEEIHNMVVNAGLERIAKLINGESVDDFSYIAIGEGAVAPQATNIELGNESTRELATTSYVADYKAKWEKVFQFGSGESYAITEVGIFDSAVVSSSIMMDRAIFTAKNVDADTDLNISVTLTVADA